MRICSAFVPGPVICNNELLFATVIAFKNESCAGQATATLLWVMRRRYFIVQQAACENVLRRVAAATDAAA